MQFPQLLEKFPTVVILGFPCNQFWFQEPATNSEIPSCIKYVRPGNGYVLPPQVTLFEKTNVNGDPSLIHPIYNYLRASCPQPQPLIDPLEAILWSPVAPVDITWNFEKFLIDKSGRPYKRYNPAVYPLDLEADIRFLLAQE